jgi:predicted aspartyl protease
MKWHQALVVVLALLWAPAGALAADTAQCSRATIGFERLPDGRILVPVTVEGRKLWFLLDTGGVATTIKWETAKALGLPVRQSVKRLAGVGGSQLNFNVMPENVSVGDLRVPNRTFYIEARSLAAADGTLSSDILRNYDVDIDLAGGNLSLSSPGACTVAATAVMAMDVAQNGHIRFPVKIDGTTISATFDSGSSVSLIGMRAAGLLGVYPHAAELSLVENAGPYQIYAYPFRVVEFDGASVKNPRIAIASDSYIPGATGDVILGMEAMRRMHFVIAYSQKRFFILGEPNPAPRP